MKAVVISQFGGPEVLKIEERPRPVVHPQEVLVNVRAAGVNRPDVFQRKGNYPAPKDSVADIPGLEIAGVIEAIGSDVTAWKIGDEVCALVSGGGYASYVAVHEDMCLPIPMGMRLEEAASLPETVYTVWDNVFRRGLLKRGENFLVHGGAGGIGSTAIQLAKIFGATVYTTVSSEEKSAYCRKLGADYIVNYNNEDFAEQWKGIGIDVVLDSIGGAYFDKNISLLADDGRLVYINAMQGGKVELNIFKMMQKRLSITGSTLRVRDLHFKKQLTKDIREKLWPVMGREFKTAIFKRFSFQDASEAHRIMESGDFCGKLILVF